MNVSIWKISRLFRKLSYQILLWIFKGTYCKTKHARGELGSYYPQEIVERIKQSFDEGVVEVWLTSEDTGAYGRDIGHSIVELLWEIIKVIPEGILKNLI